MKRKLKGIYLLIVVCLAGLFSAQKRTEEFTISLPAQKVDKSYYKTIKLIDDRIDTTSLGIVQQGALNAKARVIPTTSLLISFKMF